MNIIALGRADCGNLESALRKEWLVTNSLGGYASGTLAGANTRRYHGLLVAALRPPLGRTVMVAKIDGVAHHSEAAYPLVTNEYADGTIDPHGYRFLESFHLEGLIPVWTFALGEAHLERRIWMDHGHNTTYLTYTLKRSSRPYILQLTPLCTYRDYHSHLHGGGGWQPEVRPINGGLEVRAFDGAQPYRIVADQGMFYLRGVWYYNFKHRLETERGLDDTEDLFRPGYFQIDLEPEQMVTLICSTEPVEPHSGFEPLQRECRRQAALIPPAFADAPAWIRHLTLAADQFIVRRSAGSVKEAKDQQVGASIIAGYPWFSDWGRDTMIALPGLTLTTQRSEVAAHILQTFAHYVSQGMLPNRFPEVGQEPEYNTADAQLWYFQALYEYLRATDDMALVRSLYPTLTEIINWHERGTRYGIKVDPQDGLLAAGEGRSQLTWMDAKIGDWVVTPRIGKPVEVNALWHHALRVMVELAQRLDQPTAADYYRQQAERVAESFRQRFWFDEGNYLYDVIDTPTGTLAVDGRRYDGSLRPNQIIAVSLPFPLLSPIQAKAVVDTCAHHLLTSHGLRSLTAKNPAYISHYGGNPTQRDGAYHQGTVWNWLIGHFVTAHYRVYQDAALAQSFLTPMLYHLADAGLGSISEIFDGDPPHRPRGCFAQAYSVAEVLRAWWELEVANGQRAISSYS